MARRPDGASSRTEKWQVRLTLSGSAAADTARGPLTRSAYLRHLIAQDVKKKKDK